MTERATVSISSLLSSKRSSGFTGVHDELSFTSIRHGGFTEAPLQISATPSCAPPVATAQAAVADLRQAHPQTADFRRAKTSG